MPREPQYKPLLFTTTIRSPWRYRLFLGVFKKYDGQILNDSLAENIAGEIIKRGLYTPKRMSANVKRKIKDREPLTDQEINEVLKDNPQNHKEAGFGKGWPSRFDTWFKFAKEMGFVFYRPSGKIRFSEIGSKLVDREHPEFERQAFLNSFAKYQSNSPFRRVRNENVPLILLLQVINKLNSDKAFNGAGIAKHELPIVIYWKNNDSQKLYQRIKKLRDDFRYSPSSEIIMDICRNEIMEGKDVARSVRSIVNDYTDEFIRKMRMTGLISLRGGGRFIDINKKEQKMVEYILEHYAGYEKYDTEESYFEYISTIDEKFVSLEPESISVVERDKSLDRWVNFYSWDKIKKEMLMLSRGRSTRDEILKYLSDPVRLEFLTALAVKSKFPEVKVIPNYPVDDEGVPTATAAGSGDTGDIECFEDANGILVEVTMSGGGSQTKAEVWPIRRHLIKFREQIADSMCYFVAPSIYEDSIQQINWLRATQDLLIIPKTIEEFLEHLENNSVLYSNT